MLSIQSALISKKVGDSAVRGVVHCGQVVGSLCSGTGTHLFVKVPRPGDSDGTFSVFDLSTNCYYAV